MGTQSSHVIITQQLFLVIGHAIDRINPTMSWLHIAHSEAGGLARLAIESMTPTDRNLMKDKLISLNFAPAIPIPDEYGKDVANIYSMMDLTTAPFVTGVAEAALNLSGLGFFAGRLRYNKDRCSITVVPCVSPLNEWSGGDHSFVGTTLQKELRNNIQMLRDEYGFYNAGSR